MRKKNYKGRCEKRSLSKCQGICKTYDTLQFNYADILQNDTSMYEPIPVDKPLPQKKPKSKDYER